MKSYTDIEQSRKLAEILPIESADMWWTALDWQETKHYVEVKQDGINQPKKAIPCWSLVALLNTLPKVEGFKPVIDLDINQIRYEGTFRDELVFNGKDLINPCFEMIVKLKELNML